MTNLVTIGADCEAFGHPAVCTEPAPGSVQSSTSSSISVTNSSSQSAEIASVSTADMHFDSHGHSTDVEGNCINFETHDVDPTTTSTSLTLNGSPLYIVGDGVGTDPTSSGDIDITNSGDNNSLSES